MWQIEAQGDFNFTIWGVGHTYHTSNVTHSGASSFLVEDGSDGTRNHSAGRGPSHYTGHRELVRMKLEEDKLSVRVHNCSLTRNAESRHLCWSCSAGAERVAGMPSGFAGSVQNFSVAAQEGTIAVFLGCVGNMSMNWYQSSYVSDCSPILQLSSRWQYAFELGADLESRGENACRKPQFL